MNIIKAVKKLFAPKSPEEIKLATRKAYVAANGFDLKCYHCDEWQGNHLEINEPIKMEYNTPHPHFDIIECAACGEKTTSYDIGFMGIRIYCEHHAAVRGRIVELPKKEPPTIFEAQ